MSIMAFSQTYPILRTVPVEQTFNSEMKIFSGDYVKDTQNRLNEYQGTWQYNQNGIEFTLKLIKKPQVISIQPNGDYTYYDEIISTYKLVKNNITLVDNLNSSTYTGATNADSPKYGVFSNIETFDYINGVITDLTNNVIISRCEISKVAGNPDKIFFKLYHMHSWKRNPATFYQGLPSIYSIPNEIEMTKIN